MTERELKCPKSKNGYAITLTPEFCAISDGPEAYSSYRPSLIFPFKFSPQCSAGMIKADAGITRVKFKVSANDMKPSQSFFSDLNENEIYVLLEPLCKSKKVEKPLSDQLRDKLEESLLSKDIKGTVLFDAPVSVSDRVLFLKYHGYINATPHYPVGAFYYLDEAGEFILTSFCDDEYCRASFVTDDNYYSVSINAKSMDPKNMLEIKDKIEALIKSFYVFDSTQATGND